MFGAFFIGVDSFFNMCRVAAPNVEVEHLYSCIHFCGIAAGSSVFVRKKNTRVVSHQWKNPTEGPGPTTSRHRQVRHEIPDLSRGDVVERIFDRCRKKTKKTRGSYQFLSGLGWCVFFGNAPC